MQAGLRAGMRKEYLVGNFRIVALVENELIRKWGLFIFPCSLLCVFLSDGRVLPAIYSLNALLTLLIGLRLVQQDLKSAGAFSLSLFILNFISGDLVVLLEGYSGWVSGASVEAFSLIVGFVVFLHKRRGAKKNSNGVYVAWMIIKKYAGLQLSSFMIICASYFFSQTMLYSAETKKTDLIVVLSDAILVSGLVSMFLSRVLLVFEKKIVANQKVCLYIVATNISILLFCGIYSFFRSEGYLISFLVISFLMGKLTVAQISSFIDERFRKSFVVSVSLLLVVQAAFYLVRFAGMDFSGIEFMASGFNMLFLSIGLAVFYSLQKNPYIVGKRLSE